MIEAETDVVEYDSQFIGLKSDFERLGPLASLGSWAIGCLRDMVVKSWGGGGGWKR